MKKKYPLFALLLLILLSCENEPIFSSQSLEHNSTEFAENFGNEITRTFLGEIVDINNLPLADALVTIGNSIALTDSNGIFIIRDATVNERFGYIKANKAGYINASRTLVPSEGTNKVRIMMLPEIVTATISSGTQETVSLPSGASVTFEGNYIKDDGTTYSGNVNVIMYFLDPTDDNTQDQMPGMLYAADAQNEERMLQTFGMLAVELRGENGEDLNLAEESSAEITVPLDDSLIANAPNSIPLWYFDEVNGYWVEEGEAALQGNIYVGSVTHFSFWNCDIPAEAITLCVTVTDENNNTLNNLNVTITSNTFGTRSGYTNQNGEVCGFVPSGETLELNLYSYDLCGENALYTETVGPFNTDSSITIIALDNSDIIHETVTGQAVNCDSELINNGYIIIGTEGFTSIEILNLGVFNTQITRCETTESFSVEAFDIDTNLQSNQEIYTFEDGNTNVGNIIVCNDLDEFISYTIDGTEEFLYTQDINAQLCYNTIPDSFPTETYLFGIDAYFGNGNSENCFRLVGILHDEFDELEDTYDYWYFEDESDLMGLTFNGMECGFAMTADNTAEFNITNMSEDIGGFIDINFSLDYYDFNGQLHTMEGEMHVRRDQEECF